jgi:WD40 repeat protein
MAAAKPKFPARSTKAGNLNSVFSLTPPEGPGDDLTSEQKNKMIRATERIQHLLIFPARINKGRITAALHKWKHHTLSHITETANTTAIKVATRAGKNIPIETSVAGAQHTYTKIKHTDMIQCFLKGPTHETYTIDIPSPVTLDKLGEAIAKKTRVPTGEQRLGPMRSFADKYNTNLFHIPPLTTLQMQGGLKGGSGTERILLYIIGLQAEKIPVRIDPTKSFADLKTILADKTGISTYEMTLFCAPEHKASTQIDDLEQIKDNAPAPGTVIYASNTPAPTPAPGTVIYAEDLTQKLDSTGTWKWGCQRNCTCKPPLLPPESFKQPPVLSAAKKKDQDAPTPRNPSATTTPSVKNVKAPLESEAGTTLRQQRPKAPIVSASPAPHSLTLLPADTAVLTQYYDGVWYPATINGTTDTGYLASFKGYERDPPHAVTHHQMKQHPQSTDLSPVGNPPPRWMCELHNKDRSTSQNLVHVYDVDSQSMIWRCKPNKACRIVNPKPQTHARADTLEVEAGTRELDLDNEAKPITPHPSFSTLTTLNTLITPQDLGKKSAASNAEAVSQRQLAIPSLNFSAFHAGSSRQRTRPTESSQPIIVTGLTDHLPTQTLTSTIGPAGKTSAQTHSSVTKLQALWRGSQAPRDTIVLFVQGPKIRLKFFILPNATILQLKQQIQERIPMQQPVLIYKDKEMEDGKTIQDHGLKPNDTIHLQAALQAAAMPNTQPYPPYPPAGQMLNTPPQPTAMRDLEALRDHNPTPNGSSTPTLSTVATPEITTVNSLPRPIPMTPTAPMPQKENTDVIQFFAKTPKGNSLTMREPNDTTVGKLKARLQTKTGIPVNQQRLSYIIPANQQRSGIQVNQQRLSYAQDSATLREIALQDRGTIQVSMRLMGGMDTVKTTEQSTGTTSIYVSDLGIAVTLTSQGFEITSIHPNSPAGIDKRISTGQLIKKIDDSFSNMRDIDSVGKALQGNPLTPVTLHLQSQLKPATLRIVLIRQQNHPSDLTAEAFSRAPRIRLALPATSSRPLPEQSTDSPDRDPSPSESARSDHFSFLDPRPPPCNVSAGHSSPSLSHEKPQAPPPEDTDTLVVLRSMNKLLEGKPKGSYVSQKELAGLIYAAFPGTVEDNKRHFTQAYGERGPFTHFLRARTHPTGQPLLEWKDDTPTELRITSIAASPSAPNTKIAKLAPYASGSRPAAAATCPPPRRDDLRNSLQRAPKKPRPSEYTLPNTSASNKGNTRGQPEPLQLGLGRCIPTQDAQQHRSQPHTHTTQLSTAKIQQSMIEVCRIPRAPHTQTLTALLKTLEHHLKLPDNALEDRKDDIIDWFDLLNKLHIGTATVQASNQQPLQSLLEHNLGLDYGALTPWHKAITNWTHPPKSPQQAPAIQLLPNAHKHHLAGADRTFTWQETTFREGDFLHISYNPPSKRSSTQLVRLLQIITPERPSEGKPAKPPSAPQLKVQEWITTDVKNPNAGGYIDDKSKTLKLTLHNTTTLRLQASLTKGLYPRTGLEAEPFFNHVAQSSHWDPSLSYIEMAICRRVNKTWNAKILQGLNLSRSLSLHPRNKIRGSDWHPQATDADLERAVQLSSPETKEVDLTGQTLLSAASIHTLFDNFSDLKMVHLSDPDLMITSAAVKIRNLPNLQGLEPSQFTSKLAEMLNEGEHAPYPSPLAYDSQQHVVEGPASPLHFMDLLQNSPGCTLNIDPLYTPSAEASLSAAAKNDWHTLALRQQCSFGNDTERTFGMSTLASDNNGNTPLLLTCQRGNYEAAEVLLLNPRICPRVSLASENHLGETPLLVACQAGKLKTVILIQNHAKATWEKLIRKVRLDGHTLLTTSIQSKKTHLLHRALALPFFSLLRPEPFLAAWTFSDRLRALATASTSPDQIEHWIRGTEELLPTRVTAPVLTGTWVTYPHIIAKNTVFRLLATIIANPNIPTPLKSAIGNILGMLTQNRSLLTVCLPQAWAPAIQGILSQLAVQADCPGLWQQTPHLDLDKFLPARTVIPTAASKRQCPAKDVLVFTTTTVSLALSQDATTFARQEHNHFTATDIATGAIIGRTMNMTHAWHTQLTCLAMQWEETDARSLLWADASGGIHRWTLKSGNIESDNTNARGKHRINKIAFTLDAKAVVILSHDGYVHVAHLSPTKLTPWSFTIAQTRSIPPLSKATITTMALSPTLVTVADNTGLRIWEGAHRGCPKDAFNCLYQCPLDPQSPTTTLTFSKSGAHLAAGNTAAEVRIWNVDTGKITHQIDTGHSALGNLTSICSLAFDGDEYITSAGKHDSQAHIWHIQGKLDIGSTRLQTEPGKWESEGELPPTITHVVSAGHLVLTASNDQAITIWKILPTPLTPIEHLEAIQAVAISPSHADPNSEYGATATASGTKVKVWDYRDTLRTCISLSDTVRTLTYSANGKRLIIANDAPDISVWAPSGPEDTFLYTLKVPSPYPTPAHTPSSPRVRYTALAASDNDKRIATGTSWGQVILWNTAPAMISPGTIITPHLYPVISIEFTDKGATIPRSTDNFLHILRTADSTDQHPIALVQ